MSRDKYSTVEKPKGRYLEEPTKSTRKDRRELNRKLKSGKFELVPAKNEGNFYLRRKKSVVTLEKVQ